MSSAEQVVESLKIEDFTKRNTLEVYLSDYENTLRLCVRSPQGTYDPRLDWAMSSPMAQAIISALR